MKEEKKETRIEVRQTNKQTDKKTNKEDLPEECRGQRDSSLKHTDVTLITIPKTRK
jgi:hypothetical protein